MNTFPIFVWWRIHPSFSRGETNDCEHVLLRRELYLGLAESSQHDGALLYARSPEDLVSNQLSRASFFCLPVRSFSVGGSKTLIF